MHFKVINHSLAVGEIDVFGVSSSSMLQVGDTEVVNLYSVFDTPPESVVIGPLAPYPEPGQESVTSREGNVNE
ncbi:spore gernimation protein GerPD [Paenibacillus sp. J5C_2022]|nr:spore gernimation protein GerPD [Paenibacillus sp. J5C2022]MCU6707706.1 spore gernimation protein GerPD [Paenibacillus sp. J5C2022]